MRPFFSDFLLFSTQVVALDVSKVFNLVWDAGILHKNKSYGISNWIFGLTSFFLSNRQLHMVLDAKSLQEDPVNSCVPKASILGPSLFPLFSNDLPDVIFTIVINVNDAALYSKCEQTSDLWQELELVSTRHYRLGP